MRLEIDGRSVLAATGGGAHESGQPLVIFLHGAGMDHSVWALQSRWFAHHGARVLAVDFPGHSGSAGPPLTDIDALADWTARLVEAADAERAALETAARHPRRVASLALIGVAAKMPVHPDLLAAAKANSRDAIDMVSLWGLGPPAALGGNVASGLWMFGGAERLLEKALPGVLHADLFACNAYEAGAAAAAKVGCPTTLILGERDQMTPLKAGRALAGLIAGARTIVLPGAGHMLMIERPDEVRDAIKTSLVFS
jgi:pimeloyl-ACP methyl ester carboxylesterase